MADLETVLVGVAFAEKTVKQVEDHLRALATFVPDPDSYVFYFDHGMCVTDMKKPSQGGVLYAVPVRKDDKRTFRNGAGDSAKLIPHEKAIMNVIASQRAFLAEMRVNLEEAKRVY